MLDRMPDGMSEYMPDRMRTYISNRMPDRMPECISDRMPDRMSEYDIYQIDCQIECRNVCLIE